MHIVRKWMNFQINRFKKQLESDLNELHIQNNEMLADNQSLSAIKSKLDSELQLLRVCFRTRFAAPCSKKFRYINKIFRYVRITLKTIF